MNKKSAIPNAKLQTRFILMLTSSLLQTISRYSASCSVMNFPGLTTYRQRKEGSSLRLSARDRQYSENYLKVHCHFFSIIQYQFQQLNISNQDLKGMNKDVFEKAGWVQTIQLDSKRDMRICLLLFYLLVGFIQAKFNETLAIALGNLNAAVACKEEYILNWTCGPCHKVDFANVKTFKGKNKKTAGFIGFSPVLNAVVLVFRGTSNLNNVQTDLSYRLSSYPRCTNNCSVHRGFYQAYTDISLAIETLARQYLTQYKVPFFVTGLSLGAALAMHATAHLSSLGYNIQQFYTFGSPRVGNKLFHEWFNRLYQTGEAYRIVHNKDPIPHLPPKSLGYEHIGIEIYYNEDCSSYKICEKTKIIGEDLGCSLRHFPNLKKMMDHLQYWDMNLLPIYQDGLCH